MQGYVRVIGRFTAVDSVFMQCERVVKRLDWSVDYKTLYKYSPFITLGPLNVCEKVLQSIGLLLR